MVLAVAGKKAMRRPNGTIGLLRPRRSNGSRAAGTRGGERVRMCLSTILRHRLGSSSNYPPHRRHSTSKDSRGGGTLNCNRSRRATGLSGEEWVIITMLNMRLLGIRVDDDGSRSLCSTTVESPKSQVMAKTSSTTQPAKCQVESHHPHHTETHHTTHPKKPTKTTQ